MFFVGHQDQHKFQHFDGMSNNPEINYRDVEEFVSRRPRVGSFVNKENDLRGGGGTVAK